MRINSQWAERAQAGLLCLLRHAAHETIACGLRTVNRLLVVRLWQEGLHVRMHYTEHALR